MATQMKKGDLVKTKFNHAMVLEDSCFGGDQIRIIFLNRVPQWVKPTEIDLVNTTNLKEKNLNLWRAWMSLQTEYGLHDDKFD